MDENCFLTCLPKIELHAHLNGSLTDSILLNLIDNDPKLLEEYKQHKKLKVEQISDFFGMFGFIYKLTSSKQILTKMTTLVIQEFKAQGCRYLELRTTPKKTHLSKTEYINAVIAGLKVPGITTNLIISINREHTLQESMDTLDTIIKTQKNIVGIDICGDPSKGNFSDILPILQKARKNNFKITYHLAEISSQSKSEIKNLLSFIPDRISHLTFLDQNDIDFVNLMKIPVEICISSNVFCKTVKSVKDHHVLEYYNKTALVLCTVLII
jgi:adenosine deaminase